MPATALSAAVDLTPDGTYTVSQAAEDSGDNVNGNTFVNTGSQAVVARNSSGGSLTVTVKDSNGNTIGSALSIPAGNVAVLGPFDVYVYGAAPQLVPSAATIKFRLLELGKASRKRNMVTR